MICDVKIMLLYSGMFDNWFRSKQHCKRKFSCYRLY